MKTADNTTERRQRRRAKRRQEILDVAAHLFAVRGYAGTTADAIAQAVHLTKSALYTYVGSKEEIAVFLLEDVVQQLLERAQIIDQAPDDVETKLRRWIVEHVTVVGHHPASSLLFLHSEHILSPGRYPGLYARRDGYEAIIRRWIQRGQDLGVFAPANVKLAGFLVLGSVNWVIRWYSPKGPLSAQEIGKAYAEILIGGLKNPARTIPEPHVSTGDGDAMAAWGLSE